MAMNEPDADLRTVFAHQRKADHELAPAWNPDALRKRSTPEHPSVHWLRLLVPALACVLFAFVWFAQHKPAQREPSLADALPVLLSSQAHAAPLFASLDVAVSRDSWPSDFLTPDHFNLFNP